jgi:hypothetical protein
MYSRELNKWLFVRMGLEFYFFIVLFKTYPGRLLMSSRLKKNVDSLRRGTTWNGF